MEVVREIDELTKETWSFIFIDSYSALVLNTHSLSKRASTRHRKYKDLENFNRIMGRENTLTEEEVPFPEDVEAEALEKFFDTIRCIKWKDR